MQCSTTAEKPESDILLRFSNKKTITEYDCNCLLLKNLEFLAMFHKIGIFYFFLQVVLYLPDQSTFESGPNFSIKILNYNFRPSIQRIGVRHITARVLMIRQVVIRRIVVTLFQCKRTACRPPLSRITLDQHNRKI